MKWSIWLTCLLLFAPAISGLGTEILEETAVILPVTPETLANLEPEPTTSPTANDAAQKEASVVAEIPAPTQELRVENQRLPAALQGKEVPDNLEEIAWKLLSEELANLPLADAQAPGFAMLRFMAQPNGTNETVLNQTGTVTHTHNGVGGNGLYEAWNLPFYGETKLIRQADVNGDGSQDAVLGTSSAIVAIAGSSGEILWAYPIGNTIRSLTYMPESNEFLYATLWEGQLGEFGRIDASTGHINWKTTEPNHFVAAAPLADGILVATIDGLVIKTDNEGLEQWRYDTRIIPDVSAILVAHINMGTYLAEPADYNGDGITDMAVATLNLRFVIGLYANSIEYYTQIHAVNGATGEILWLGQENADPVVGISINALADLEAFDARGDGSQDLAYDGITLRFYYVSAAFMITYETFLRALDGDSQVVAQPLGGRTLPGVLLPLEIYGDIERVDANADGMEEVAVIRLDIANQLLGGTTNIESYSFTPHAPDYGATMVVSDVVLQNGDSPTISTFEGDGIELFVGSTQDNQGLLVSSNLQDVTSLEFTSTPRVGAVINGEVAFATTSDFQQTNALTPLRGTAENLFTGHYDNDGTPDFFVVSSDKHVYSIDGLNGMVAQVTPYTGEVLNVEDINNDGQVEIITLPPESAVDLRAISLDGSTLWSADRAGFAFYNDEAAIFDGNGDGVMDYLVNSYEATAINGANGKTLWSTGDRLAIFPDEITGTIDGDILVLDYRDVSRVDGKNGKTQYTYDAGSFVSVNCIGNLMTEAGPQTLLAQDSSNDGSQLLSLSGNGAPREIPLFGDGELISCEISATDGDSLISYRILQDETMKQRLARISSTGAVWDVSAGNSGDRYTPIGLDEATNTMYFAWQDHVRGRNWTTGETISDFGFNGPFVIAGTMANVDRLGSPEIASLASNGILWLVSTDEGVQETLSRQAQNLGKDPIPTVDENVPLVKETPFPFALLALGLLALVRRRKA